MAVNLSTPTAQVVFPVGTVDGPWNFTLTGTNPDGSDYNWTQDADSPSIAGPDDLQPGAVVTLVVSKNGVSSQPSAPFTVPGGPVTLTVPDANQPATITAA